jgi:hypothetical protein
MSGDFEDAMLLAVFIRPKFIDELGLHLQVAYAIDLELELSIVLDYLVSEVDVSEQICYLQFRKEMIEEASLKFRVGKTHVLIYLDN